MITAIGTVLAAYLIFVLLLYLGWRKTFAMPPVKDREEDFITVIVPVRNEQENIRQVLHDLLGQHYTAFEIIVVDDHSEDQTEAVIASIRSPFIKCIQSTASGKKNAITTGISVASGRIVATTDADCSIPPGWLTSINNFFSDPMTLLAIGPVAMQGEGSVFSHMQQIEFSTLIGTAASTAGWGMPVMCNGASLAFSKDAFVAVKGFEGNIHVASGDDEFLMRKIHANAPGSVRFIADPGAVVKTRPQKTVGDFLEQRLRWAGKWKFNSSMYARLLAVFIFMIQIATIACCYLLVTTGQFVWLSFIAIRALAEIFIVKIFCGFLKIRIDWVAFMLVFFTYPFYVVYVGMLSNFHSYEWKGRKYRN
jgi:poly-beta-1,6-N-acetyl-D-glucosamine synthase